VVVTVQKLLPLPDTNCPTWPFWIEPSSPPPSGTRQQKEVSAYSVDAWSAYECERLDNEAKLKAMRDAEKLLAPAPSK
jgi:hypothetical protein